MSYKLFNSELVSEFQLPRMKQHHCKSKQCIIDVWTLSKPSTHYLKCSLGW